MLPSSRPAFADSYSDGYNEGCYDADRDFKGLNGHGREKGLYLRIECKLLYNVDNKNITYIIVYDEILK